MELDLSNIDHSQKVSELKQQIIRTEDALVEEKLKNQNYSDQIQALQIEQAGLIEYYETVIAEHRGELVFKVQSLGNILCFSNEIQIDLCFHDCLSVNRNLKICSEKTAVEPGGRIGGHVE